MRAAPQAPKGAASHSVTFASSRPSPDSTLEASYRYQRTGGSSSDSSGRDTHSGETGYET